MIAVIDANVLVKLFLNESGSELAESVVLDHRIITAPCVARWEVASAITRAARNRLITDTEARQKLAEWRRFVELGSIRLLDSATLQPAAEELSLAIHHPLVDCFYLQLAITTQAPLITSDRPLVDAGSPAYKHIQHLFDLTA